MGFPTAFVSSFLISKPLDRFSLTKFQIAGFTLTATTLYLTATLHKRNRLIQSAALQQSNLILQNLVEPLSPAPPPGPYTKISFVESAKDQWNEEVEGLVRRVQGTDWRGLGDEAVNGVLGLVKRLRGGGSS
jgi:altered-inheritance-of-mitochondria protein 5